MVPDYPKPDHWLKITPHRPADQGQTPVNASANLCDQRRVFDADDYPEIPITIRADVVAKLVHGLNEYK